MRWGWLLVLLVACTGSAPTPPAAAPCAPWPREMRLKLPATEIDILRWHDRQRERDHKAYLSCAGDNR